MKLVGSSYLGRSYDKLHCNKLRQSLLEQTILSVANVVDFCEGGLCDHLLFHIRNIRGKFLLT